MKGVDFLLRCIQATSDFLSFPADDDELLVLTRHCAVAAADDDEGIEEEFSFWLLTDFDSEIDDSC